MSPEARKYHWHRTGYLEDVLLIFLIKTTQFAYLSDEGGKCAVVGQEMVCEMVVKVVEVKGYHSQPVPAS